MNSELAHSPLGPSASSRWLACPGSVLATKDLPDHSSSYAIEGTAAHILAEWARNDSAPASVYLGQDIPVHTDDGVVNIQVDQEMVNNIQEFLDYVNDFEGEAFYEVRVNFDAWVPGGFGAADDIRIRDGLCRVTDLKYGQGIKVYAEDNTQGLLYALGVFQEFGHLYDIEEFEIVIHQPRLNHVDEWTISITDLLEWADNVAKPGAELALTAGAPFKAGKHCTFCKVRHTCKARAEQVLEKTIKDFDNLDELEGAELLDPTTLTNEQIGDILPMISALKSWCSDIEKKALSELGQGHKVSDWKLVAGRSSRSWKDTDAAEAALRGSKLKVAQIFTKKLVTPPQAEKLLGKKHPIIISQVHKSAGKPTLAPGSDKRKPLEINPEDEFEVLT